MTAPVPRFPWKEARQAPAAPVTVREPAIVAQVPRVALSGRGAAAALSISLSTMAALERNGDGPPSFVLPGGRRRLYPLDLLIRWAADQAAAAGDQDQATDDGEGTP